MARPSYLRGIAGAHPAGVPSLQPPRVRVWPLAPAFPGAMPADAAVTGAPMSARAEAPSPGTRGVPDPPRAPLTAAAPTSAPDPQPEPVRNLKAATKPAAVSVPAATANAAEAPGIPDPPSQQRPSLASTTTAAPSTATIPPQGHRSFTAAVPKVADRSRAQEAPREGTVGTLVPEQPLTPPVESVPMIPPSIAKPAARAGTNLRPSAEEPASIPPRTRAAEPAAETAAPRRVPPVTPAAFNRPAEPTRVEARSRRGEPAAAENRIHIGAIEIHIAPPPKAPAQAPPPPRRTVASVPAPAISRSFTASFGLRQG